MPNKFLAFFSNKITLIIIQGLSGTVGFGVLFFYGYSSQTVFTFAVLLCIPFILRGIAFEKLQEKSIENKHSKIKISSIFTFLAIIFGFLAGLIAVIKMDRKAFQSIMENKLFLIALYLSFISGLIGDATDKPKKDKE